MSNKPNHRRVRHWLMLNLMYLMFLCPINNSRHLSSPSYKKRADTSVCPYGCFVETPFSPFTFQFFRIPSSPGTPLAWLMLNQTFSEERVWGYILLCKAQTKREQLFTLCYYNNQGSCTLTFQIQTTLVIRTSNVYTTAATSVVNRQLLAPNITPLTAVTICSPIVLIVVFIIVSFNNTSTKHKILKDNVNSRNLGLKIILLHNHFILSIFFSSLRNNLQSKCLLAPSFQIGCKGTKKIAHFN